VALFLFRHRVLPILLPIRQGLNSLMTEEDY
jgi:hypothetical protein